MNVAINMDPSCKLDIPFEPLFCITSSLPYLYVCHCIYSGGGALVSSLPQFLNVFMCFQVETQISALKSLLLGFYKSHIM